MSYILEALQEAQKNRDNTEVPDIKSTQGEPSSVQRGRNKWLGYLLVGSAVTVVGLGIVWRMESSRQAGESERPDLAVQLAAGPKIIAPPATKPLDGVIIQTGQTATSVHPAPENSEKAGIKKPFVSLNPISLTPSSDVQLPDSSVSQRPITGAPVLDESTSDSLAASDRQEDDGLSVLEIVMQPETGKSRSKYIGDTEHSPREKPLTALAEQKNPVSDVTVKAPSRVGSLDLQQEADPEADFTVEDKVESITQNTVPHFRTLPSEVQASLPSIVYSVHIFAQIPARRMVKIDGRVRREGDTVKPGLVLEEITPTGAIFSFRGDVFLIPVNG